MHLEWLTALIAIMAWIYLALGLDDLLLDFYYWVKSRGGRFSARRKGNFATVEKPIAIIVPAWKEAGIIGAMLRGNLKGLHYSNFKFFVACYPNDLDTINEVKSVNDERVVCVINHKEGPTSKGQALNEVVRYLLASPETYAAVLMQDSEDIMHPYVLQSVNTALESFDFIQTPVYSLPLALNDYVSASYLDEFAEFHTKHQWVRTALNTATPSAGVGTAISFGTLTQVIKSRGHFLYEGSLTEDYELGHFVHRLGGRSIFLREILDSHIQTLSQDALRGPAVRQIATLEYFPRRFRAAIRQKTRWTIGIVLQGSAQVGWYGSFANRYFLYRDRKGLVMNMLGLIGMATALLSSWVIWEPQVSVATVLYDPMIGEATRVCLMFNLFLAGNRCVQRCLGVHRVYRDWGLTLTAPLRIPVSLFINGFAAINALQRFFKSKLQNITLTWDKTQHELPQGFGGSEPTFEPNPIGMAQRNSLNQMQLSQMQLSQMQLSQMQSITPIQPTL